MDVVATQRRLHQLINGSSAHGLSHAVLGPTARSRLVWTSILVGGVCGLLVNLSRLGQRFADEPVLTTSTLRLDTFQWPDLLVCNPGSPVPFSKDARLVEKWRSLADSTRALPVSPVVQEEVALSSMDHRDLGTTQIQPLVKEWAVDWRSHGLPMTTEETRLSAGRVGRFSRLWVPNPHFTTCFVYRVAELRDRGSVRGMHVTLELNLEDHLRLNSSRQMRYVYVAVVPPRHSPLSYSEVKLTTGVEAVFKISLSRITRLDTRGRCRHDHFAADVVDATLQRRETLKGGKEDCERFAAQMLYLKHCGCYGPFLPVYVSSQSRPRLCFNITIFNATGVLRNLRCVEKVQETFVRNNEFQTFQKCSRYRKPLCNELEYSVSVHKYDFPRQVPTSMKAELRRYTRGRQNGMEFFRANYLRIQFERDGEFVRHIDEEKEYPLSHMLSDVGGTLGLWVGLSAISIFELIEISVWFMAFLRKR